MSGLCEICSDPSIDGRRCLACRTAMAAPPLCPAFEIGCRARPLGADIEGELLEFNAPVTGALIRWDGGEEIWKALRTLEVISLPTEPRKDRT